MRDKHTAPLTAIFTNPTPVPLPPRPGVKTIRRLADACPRCLCMHTSVEAAQACQSMVAQREQP